MLSFAEDAELTGKNVFHIDFQRGENPSTLEKVWLATSGGLQEYDGYGWRQHGVAQGLPSDFIRCVLVTRRGDLWVGTDRGAGIYDGKTFRLLATETNLAGPSVRRMVEDIDGTIWFCSDPWPSSARSGGLTSLRDGKWTAFTVKDGLPSEYVVNYFRDASNRQWVVTKDGIAKWGGSNWVTSLTPGVGRDSFSSGCFAEAPGRPLMFSSGTDVYLLLNNVWTSQPISTKYPHHQHGICTTKDGKILSSVSTSPGRKTISEWGSAGWAGVSAEFDLPRGYNEDIRESPDGNIWVIGFETVICWRRHAQWEVFRNVPPPKFVEPSNRIWFGKDGWGVLPALTPVRFERGYWERLESPYDDVFPDGTGAVWGWSSNGVTRWVGTNTSQFTESDTGLNVIQAGRSAPAGAYWLVGLNRNGQQATACFLDGHWEQYPLPNVSGTFAKPGIAALRDSLWMISRPSDRTNAVAINISTNKTTLVEVPAAILSEFHHGLHVSADGSNVWLYGDNGLYRTHAGNGRWEAITNLPGRTVVGLVERGNEVWVGCNGATGGSIGLARYRDGEWKTFPIRSLMNLSLAADLTLLIGGKGGLTVVENTRDAIPMEIEFPEDIRADGVVKDRNGDYWAGNDTTLLRFNPDRIPTETRIVSATTNILHGGRFTITIDAIERFRPSGHREDHSFSWRIDDQEWSPFQQRLGGGLSIPDLAVGAHSIAVRSRDAGGDIDPTPAVFEFTVHPLPLQSRGWFLASMAAVIILLASFAFVAIRARTELASYARTLEHRVAERTAALEAELAERRRAEQERERLVLLVEHSADFIATAELNGQLTYLNPAGRRMIGFGESEDIRKLNFADYVPERWRSWFIETVVPIVREKGVWEGEMQLFHLQTRQLIDISRSMFLVRNRETGDPIGFATVTRDVTARKAAEKALLESEERFAKAFRANPAIIAISTYPEGKYVDVNEAFTESLGFTRAEILGRTALELGVWSVPSQRQAITKAVGERRLVRGVECQLRAKSGDILTVLASVELIELSGQQCLLFINHDITDRKASERKVSEAQARFQQLAENIREVFWLTNAEKSQMLYISPGYERIWGRSCESLYRSPESWLESIHADDRKRVASSLPENQSQGTYDLEYRILRPDGSVRWVHDRTFPVRDASGAVYRIAGIAEDITERRQLEAQFRQAQKMEALGTLSGGIAHDFNNILGAIFGNVHLASLDLQPSHPASNSLGEIQKAANRARDLVRQILAFSRQQPKTRQNIALGPVVQEAAGLLRASLPAGIELVKTLDPKAPNVFADATQIHQIILNLCTNAWHAIGEGPGRIEIQLQPVEIKGEDSAPAPELHRGVYACLSVIDSGHGMDASTLERIFEPFFTTKDPGRGTGLGLSVVHGIVQSHDGVIRVSSQRGQGTSFHLYFPAAGAESVESTPTKRSLRKGLGERILYLDDEKPLVDLAVKMLRRLAYDADGYTHPDAALEAFKSNPAFYQLIITDLHMPGLSGIEFIQAVRKLHPTVPIILSSGHLTDDIVTRVRNMGVTRVLHKPNTMDDFSDSLHELLHKLQP
ncbi:MAG: PAS domain S-box protein [Verrucomicrobia bacterium]|nr:PAS domain S-box protein [Verrucomicrobiota bacterium]